MGLNDFWARQCMAERGTTIEQIAAAAVKARRNASLNPLARSNRRDGRRGTRFAQVAGVLTRLMCSSFTDGAAAVILAPMAGAPGDAPRIIGSVARSGNGEIDYHERLAETADAAWEAFGHGPGDFDMVELHDATSAEELYALESLGSSGTARPGRPPSLATRPLAARAGGQSEWGLVGRGHPLGATGIAQVVELANHLRGGWPTPGPGARLGWP